MKVKTKQHPEEWLEVYSAHGSGDERVYELSNGEVVRRSDIVEFRYDEELGDIKLKLDS